MSGSATAIPSSSMGFNARAFFELLWRSSGIQFVGLVIIAYAVYGYQPQAGASSATLSAFYHSHHMRILIAAFISGLAVLYLMWFAAAIRVALAEAGDDGWGSAATAASAAVGALFLLLTAINAGMAYSMNAPGSQSILTGMNGFAWSGFVLSSFVRAMLIMSAAFGFWRAGLISNGLFTIGVAAVVLTVIGGAMWASGGFFAPDGAYSRFISPIIGLLWAIVVSWILLKKTPSTRTGW